MIRILRIINRFNLGGITYNVSYLSRYLGSDFDTMLAGGPEEKNEASSLYIPRGLGLQPLVLEEMRRSVNPMSDFLAYRRICGLIRQFKPHIVHTHASKAGALGRLAAIRCRVPLIVHTFHGHVFHGYFGSAKTWLYKAIERWLAKRTHAVVAISERQREELVHIHRICPASKVHVVPLGFDLARFSQGADIKRGAFRNRFNISGEVIAVGIIGRLVPVKNHILFLDAVKSVRERSDKRIVGVIVGDGECRGALELHATRIGLPFAAGSRAVEAPAVIFTGWIKEVDEALAGLDIVCLTSHNEGTPVSLIEAQAAGKFIVSTNVGGIADILMPGNGYLSEPGDVAGFTGNLLRAVKEFTGDRASAAAAAAEVRERFSYQRLCRDMAELYARLLENNAQASR